MDAARAEVEAEAADKAFCHQMNKVRGVGRAGSYGVVAHCYMKQAFTEPKDNGFQGREGIYTFQMPATIPILFNISNHVLGTQGQGHRQGLLYEHRCKGGMVPRGREADENGWPGVTQHMPFAQL